MWSSDAQVTRLSLRVDGSGVVLASVKKTAKGLMSKPTNRRPRARDSTAVVPPPTNGSNTMSSLAGQVINDGGSQVWVQARKISVGLVCQTVDVLTLSIGFDPLDRLSRFRSSNPQSLLTRFWSSCSRSARPTLNPWVSIGLQGSAADVPLLPSGRLRKLHTS